MTRAGKRSWLATLLCLLMLISVAIPAMAQTPALTQSDAVQFLQDYQIVQGDQFGNLNLDKTITRAELAKITVMAMGNGNLAPMLASAVSFRDSVGHWGAGYIEAAARMGLIKGRDANTFDPDAPITYAEALTILLRMVGKEPAGLWNPVQIMQTSASLGLIGSGSAELLASVPAIRGPIFESLTRSMTEVRLPDGQTLATKYLDNEPPELSVSAPAATVDETVTVSGTASGASAVTVNGVAATLTGNRFSAVVSVKTGENRITVVARDRAGNEKTQTVTVVRGGDVASISISGPTSVKPGESVVLAVTAADAQGRALPSRLLTASVKDGMGTFDTTTNTFTAGTKAGPAHITLRSGDVAESYTVDVLGLAATAAGLRLRAESLSKGLTVGKAWTVEVEVVDAEGVALTFDDGRTVSLETTGLPGVTLNRTSAKTSNGVASFIISSSVEGIASLLATASGLEDAEDSVTFTTNHRIVLSADPSSVVANGSTVVNIRATLQDEDGKPIINNTGEDIYLTLTAPTFDGYMGNQYLVIRRGTSSSAGQDGDLVAGYASEIVRVGATITSSHKFTVVPISISFKQATIGSAARLEVAGGDGTWIPGRTVDLVVRAVDNNGNTIPTANVAFQLEVSTTNNEVLSGGIPEDLELTLGDTGYTPIAAADDAVIGRTVDGRAQLRLTYPRSGIVTIKVTGVKNTDEAYDDRGDYGKASAGTSLASSSSEIRFVGTAAKLKAVVDLPAAKLTDQEVGVLPANGRGTATVKVYVLDAADGWIPTAGHSVTLSIPADEKSVPADTGIKLSGNRSSQTATAKNGVAAFTVTSTKVADTTTLTAAVQGLTAGAIDIVTTDQILSMPSIEFLSGDVSGVENRVTLDDTGLRVDLGKYSVGDYGYVKVFRSGSNSPIYTSDVIDLFHDPDGDPNGGPWIVVPLEKLPTSDRYAISVNNGYGDSEKSFGWPMDTSAKVVVEKAANISITSVYYDANVTVDGKPSSQLIVTARGVQSSGTIDPSKLFLVDRAKPQERDSLSVLGFTCKTGSGGFTCTVDGKDFLEPHNGVLILDTENGWYTRDASGETAGVDETTSDNRVVPMAFVDHAGISFMYDKDGLATGGTLTLYGANLTDGTLSLAQVKIGNIAVGSTTVKPTSSTRANISLTKAAATNILANAVGDDLTLELGWLYASKAYDNGSIDNIPVYVTPRVTGVTYDKNNKRILISGSGFTDATIKTEQLRFVDRRGNATPMAELNSVVGGLTVGNQDDKTIEIVLSDTLFNKLDTFGDTVYLSSLDPDTESWYQTSGWLGEALPRYRVK